MFFGMALIAAYLTNDQLSGTYLLAGPELENEDTGVQEITLRTQAENEAQLDAERKDPESEQSGVEVSIDEDAAIDEEAKEDLETEVSVSEPEKVVETAEKITEASTLKFIDQFPSFRGPYGLGISYHKNLPVDWDGPSGKNILWKSKIPLSGYNSPVIWGEKLFLSGASKTEQYIYCYNRSNGELMWAHPVNDVNRTSGAVPRVTDDTGYAAPTIVTDGNNVCAIYATGDVACIDMAGNRKWAKNLGMPDNHYGHSSSLLIHQGLLLVQFDTNKAGKVLALDLANGEKRWETARTSKISWASPILADLGDHFELILSSSPQVAAYNPVSGEELWSVECLMGEVGPSPAYYDGVVYATNEYASLAAIKPGSPPEILWETNDYLPEVASPVVDDGLIFIATSYGVIACYDASNGEILWEYECDDGIYASPVIADNKVFFLDMGGIMHIFSKERTMKLLGEPELGEKTVSTPSFSDGRIYLRSDDYLYSIGN